MKDENKKTIKIEDVVGKAGDFSLPLINEFVKNEMPRKALLTDWRLTHSERYDRDTAYITLEVDGKKQEYRTGGAVVVGQVKALLKEEIENPVEVLVGLVKTDKPQPYPTLAYPVKKKQ